MRHVFHHGTYLYPELHRRLDIAPDTPLWVSADSDHKQEQVQLLRARSSTLSIQRLADRKPASIDSLLDAGRLQGRAVSLPATAWTIDEVPGPNVTDRETVLSFARMAANSYVSEPHTGDWQDVS